MTDRKSSRLTARGSPFGSGERNYETEEELSRGRMVQIRINVAVPDEVFETDGSLEPFLATIREFARDR